LTNIKRDDKYSPIPQYLNLETNEYEALTGSDGASNVNIKSFADAGTDATGVIQPTGGTGIRGWLSGIYSKLIEIFTTLGDKTDEAVIDPTLSASEISLLKGVLKQLQGNQKVSLVYSNENYGIPISIPTTETAITTGDTWVYNIIVNNIMPEPMCSVQFSLMNGDGTVIFSNLYASPMEINQIQGPIFFKGGIRAVANTEGATIILTT